MNNLSPKEYQSYEDFKKGENLTNEEASSLWMDYVLKKDQKARYNNDPKFIPKKYR